MYLTNCKGTERVDVIYLKVQIILSIFFFISVVSSSLSQCSQIPKAYSRQTAPVGPCGARAIVIKRGFGHLINRTIFERVGKLTNHYGQTTMDIRFSSASFNQQT